MQKYITTISQKKASCKRDHRVNEFSIAVNKELIEKIVLCLFLACRSSFRSIIEFIDTIFDYKISIGTVYNTLKKNGIKAKEISDNENLAGIKECALDEMFQNGPTLVGVCLKSLYCFLAQQEEHRDETTWGVHLLDLKEKGFDPKCVVADGAKGIRAAHNLVLPDVPYQADVFHAVRDMTKLLTFLENKALKALGEVEDLDKKIQKAKAKGKDCIDICKKREDTEDRYNRTVRVLETIEILFKWIRDDILSFTGPIYAERQVLFLWIIQEVGKLESIIYSDHIRKVRVRLSNQSNELIFFVKTVDKKLEELASNLKIDLVLIRQLYGIQKYPQESLLRVNQENTLRSKLKSSYYHAAQGIKAIFKEVYRTSSAVENFNSRLRPQYFIRKGFQQELIDLERFGLNHRRFARSAHNERIGKSPTEILFNKTLPHWLESLGYSLFKRSVA